MTEPLVTYREMPWGASRLEILHTRALPHVFGWGPIPPGLEWSGGRNYSQRYPIEDDYYFNGTYTYQRYVAFGCSQVLEIGKRGNWGWKKSGSGYSYTLYLQRGRDKKEVKSGTAKSLQKVFDAVQRETRFLHIYIDFLLRDVYEPSAVACVYQYNRMADAWVPFCSHFLRVSSVYETTIMGKGVKGNLPFGEYIVVSGDRRRGGRASHVSINSWGYSSGPPRQYIPPLRWWCFDAGDTVPPMVPAERKREERI